MKRQAGFTLIEVMMAVVIIGILAAIAFPSYREYVLRGHRSEGVALLSEAAARQERYYAQNNTYADSVAKLSMDADSDNDYYRLSVVAADATSYTLLATAINSQVDDLKCGNLGLNEQGVKTETGTAADAADCWR
ncbi:type IV pilin protein [Halopseudomonas aestusnigri]|jgi:type IV pilus assembly protein PilE|uniref:type IV pilin protein n=1 Tax=Halopseudomonas TaxID=2901189 RepID=UPI000C655130|nr:type IV pilin protein [Halopseudomonas aestusnigri]MAF87724.1 pilus assembly protein PilE [Pseudomonas sp.]UGV31419.1 type IV pilin protein [Halopseudomonas aestusnigri]|tara:strand:- start:87 stop:491 length:405 start_codon:yes stop_codon:yes gene_type:complete